MPAATPLSGCRLKRLEVHDRLADSVYEAAQLDAALTLSLEGQRSPSGDRGDLVLQAHCGLRRVLSFQLTHLLNEPQGKTDSVSIDKDAWQLCVHSQQHGQRVLVSFAEARDFNVAACVLNKFGFQVRPGISPTNPPPLRHQSVASPGPRLSSITPLPWPGAPDEQSSGGPGQSFASMLSSSVPISQSGAIYPQAQSLPLAGSPHHLVPQTMMPPAVYHSPFNPYHVFLGRQVHPHQPLMGSPLRHSFQVEGAPDPAVMAGSDPLAYPNGARLGMLQDGRSISVPVLPHFLQGSQESQTSQFSPDPHLLYSPGLNPSPLNFTPPSGVEGFSASTEPLSLPQSQVQLDIHDLMPRPRELPFAQKGKKKPAPKPKRQVKAPSRAKSEAKSKPAAETKSRRKAQPPKKLIQEMEAQAAQPSPRIVPAKAKAKAKVGKAEAPAKRKPPPKPPQDAPAADEAQAKGAPPTDTPPPPPPRQEPHADRRTRRSKDTPGCRPGASPPAVSHPPPCRAETLEAAAAPPTMLLTDGDVLGRINGVTSKLLGQYEADVARGCGAEAYARFYAERIHLLRRDFWLAELTRGESFVLSEA